MSDEVKIPSIRRVGATTISSELIDVQPLGMPTGTMFYMDFKYGNETEEQRIAAENARKEKEKQERFKKNFEEYYNDEYGFDGNT